MFAEKIPEPVDLKLPNSHSGRNILISFSGQSDSFARLGEWHSYLSKQIEMITRERWLQAVRALPPIPVGIHIRRGDFVIAGSSDDFYTKGGLKTPLEWFVKSLNIIRRAVGYCADAFVFSDGTREELRDLLTLDRVYHIRIGSAIGDLLALSKCSILIASGGSSFSAWAAFLGQMPAISHPGQSLAWFKLSNVHGYYVGEFDPDLHDSSFLGQAQSILRTQYNP